MVNLNRRNIVLAGIGAPAALLLPGTANAMPVTTIDNIETGITDQVVQSAIYEAYSAFAQATYSFIRNRWQYTSGAFTGIFLQDPPAPGGAYQERVFDLTAVQTGGLANAALMNMGARAVASATGGPADAFGRMVASGAFQLACGLATSYMQEAMTCRLINHHRMNPVPARWVAWTTAQAVIQPVSNYLWPWLYNWYLSWSRNNAPGNGRALLWNSQGYQCPAIDILLDSLLPAMDAGVRLPDSRAICGNPYSGRQPGYNNYKTTASFQVSNTFNTYSCTAIVGSSAAGQCMDVTVPWSTFQWNCYYGNQRIGTGARDLMGIAVYHAPWGRG